MPTVPAFASKLANLLPNALRLSANVRVPSCVGHRAFAGTLHTFLGNVTEPSLEGSKTFLGTLSGTPRTLRTLRGKATQLTRQPTLPFAGSPYTFS